METFRRESAVAVIRADAAAALDRVFEGYVVPISFSEPAYAMHVGVNDVDPAASPIWYDGDGNVVAAGVLGVRGTRGWIGGFGVAPPFRGRGLGHALLAEMIARARQLGLASLVLEVLVENAPALRTYESGGFRTRRRLLTLEANSAIAATATPDAPYTDALRLLDAGDTTVPCWQREFASLRRHPNLHAVGDARSFCIFRHNGERAQMLGIRAESPEDFARLAASIVDQTGVTHLGTFNEPDDSRVAAAAGGLGWDVVHVALEMVLDL